MNLTNEQRAWRPDRIGGLRYVVKQLVWADFAGSAYRFARKHGKVQRFWTRKAAQAYADNLNREATNEEFISEESKYGQE